MACDRVRVNLRERQERLQVGIFSCLDEMKVVFTWHRFVTEPAAFNDFPFFHFDGTETIAETDGDVPVIPTDSWGDEELMGTGEVTRDRGERAVTQLELNRIITDDERNEQCKNRDSRPCDEP